MKYLSFFLRALILLCLFLGLYFPQKKLSYQRVYVLDISQSFLDNLPNAWEWIRKSLQTLPPQGKAALVVFAKTPHLAIPFTPKGKWPPKIDWASFPIERDRTNIEAALQFALQMTKGQGQILLLSDGNENQGNCLPFFSLPHLYTVLLPQRESSPKVLHLRYPTEVPPRHPFWVKIQVKGKSPALLSLETPSQTLERRLDFSKKEVLSLEFPLSFPKEGFYPIKLKLGSQEIQFAIWCTPLRTKGLWISKEPVPSSWRPLFTKSTPEIFKGKDFLVYPLLVLDGEQGTKLSEKAWQKLQNFVQNTGGKVLFTFPPTLSLPLWQSEREKILPLRFFPKGGGKNPLFLLLALDHSGSMAESLGRFTKWEQALESLASHSKALKKASLFSLLLFSKESQVHFAPSPPPKNLAKKLLVLQGLSPQGGTNLFAPLLQGFSLLSSYPTYQKLFVVISDGRSQVRSKKLLQRVQKLRQKISHLRLLFFAIGDNPDLSFLSQLANLLEGKVQRIHSLKQIGNMLSGEVASQGGARLSLKREKAIPKKKGLPLFNVQGYWQGKAAKGAEVLYQTEKGFPLLAKKTLGTGEVFSLATSFSFLPSVLSSLWFSPSPHARWRLEYHSKRRKLLLHTDHPRFSSLSLLISGEKLPLERISPLRFQSPDLSFLSPGLYPVQVLEKGKVVFRKFLWLPSWEQKEGFQSELLQKLGRSIRKAPPPPPPLPSPSTPHPWWFLLALFLLFLEEWCFRKANS